MKSGEELVYGWMKEQGERGKPLDKFSSNESILGEIDIMALPELRRKISSTRTFLRVNKVVFPEPPKGSKEDYYRYSRKNAYIQLRDESQVSFDDVDLPPVEAYHALINLGFLIRFGFHKFDSTNAEEKTLVKDSEERTEKLFMSIAEYLGNNFPGFVDPFIGFLYRDLKQKHLELYGIHYGPF